MKRKMNKEEMQENFIDMIDAEYTKKEEEYIRKQKNHPFFDAHKAGIAEGLLVITMQNRVIIEQLKIIADKI